MYLPVFWKYIARFLFYFSHFFSIIYDPANAGYRKPRAEWAAAQMVLLDAVIVVRYSLARYINGKS